MYPNKFWMFWLERSFCWLSQSRLMEGISAAMLCQNVNKLSRIFRLFDFDGYFCLIPIQNLLGHQVCQYFVWLLVLYLLYWCCNFVTKLGFNIKTGLPEGSIFEERSSETEFSIGFLVKFCRNWIPYFQTQILRQKFTRAAAAAGRGLCFLTHRFESIPV